MTGCRVSAQLYKKVINLLAYPGLCKKEIREVALALKKGYLNLLHK
jgi:dTDP-4-amino-4,6-dideoxygalactose transaminase